MPRKLGLKDGQTVAFSQLPDGLRDLTSSRDFLSVETVGPWRELEGDRLDVIHIFTDKARDVRQALPALREMIRPDGMMWVSWPKKASNVPTDVTEDTIREAALADLLVDVKVCAVDAIWSGLKLVIRKEHRP